MQDGCQKFHIQYVQLVLNATFGGLQKGNQLTHTRHDQLLVTYHPHV